MIEEIGFLDGEWWVLTGGDWMTVAEFDPDLAAALTNVPMNIDDASLARHFADGGHRVVFDAVETGGSTANQDALTAQGFEEVNNRVRVELGFDGVEPPDGAIEAVPGSAVDRRGYDWGPRPPNWVGPWPHPVPEGYGGGEWPPVETSGLLNEPDTMDLSALTKAINAPVKTPKPDKDPVGFPGTPEGYAEATRNVPQGFVVDYSASQGRYIFKRDPNTFLSSEGASAALKKGFQTRDNGDGTFVNVPIAEVGAVQPPLQFRDLGAAQRAAASTPGFTVGVRDGFYTLVPEAPPDKAAPRRSLDQTIGDFLISGDIEAATALDIQRDLLDTPRGVSFSDAVNIAAEHSGGDAGTFTEIFESLKEASLASFFGEEPVPGPSSIDAAPTRGGFGAAVDQGFQTPPTVPGSMQETGSDSAYFAKYEEVFNDEIASGSSREEADATASAAAEPFRLAPPSLGSAAASARTQYEQAIAAGANPAEAAVAFGQGGPNARRFAEFGFSSALQRGFNAFAAGATRQPFGIGPAPATPDGVPPMLPTGPGSGSMEGLDVSELDARARTDLFLNVPTDDSLLQTVGAGYLGPGIQTDITYSSAKPGIVSFTDAAGQRQTIDTNERKPRLQFSNEVIGGQFGISSGEVDRLRGEAQGRVDVRAANVGAQGRAAGFAQNIVPSIPPKKQSRRRLHVGSVR